MSVTTQDAYPKSHRMRRQRVARTASRNRAHLSVEFLEPRTLLSVNLSVGPNVLVNPKRGNQSETAIAINPTNPLNLFAIANDETSSQVFANYSTDGGVTWSLSTVAGLPPTFGDAQTAWDSFGNLFVTYLNSSLTAIITIMSTDGGQSFSVINTTSGTRSGSLDQPSIAVGPSNFGDDTRSVWISYENFSANGGQGAITVKGAVVTGLGQVTSFIAPKLAPGSGQLVSQSGPGNFGNIAVGPSGQVLVTYENPSSTAGPAGLYVNLDANGFSGDFGPALLVTQTNVGGFAPITPQPTRSTDAEVNLAYDDSGGPNTGRVYMVYIDRPAVADTGDTDVYERYSDNDGLTWSDRVLVNDDGPANKAHFLPALAVDQSGGTLTSGFLAVTWYDCRNSPLDNSAQVWGTISIDGGQSFLPNVQISRGLINAHASDPGFEFGDYDLMDFNHGTFYRSWTDNTLPGHSGLNLATAPVSVIFTGSPATRHHPDPQTLAAAALANASDAGAPDPSRHPRTPLDSKIQSFLLSTTSLSSSFVPYLSGPILQTDAHPEFARVAGVHGLFGTALAEKQGVAYFQPTGVERSLADGMMEMLDQDNAPFWNSRFCLGN